MAKLPTPGRKRLLLVRYAAHAVHLMSIGPNKRIIIEWDG
jgi:hypothetical protein